MSHDDASRGVMGAPHVRSWTAWALVRGLREFSGNPDHAYDVRMMKAELERRVGIWVGRGHTRKEALEIMGLTEAQLR